jgi:hypothetical protein
LIVHGREKESWGENVKNYIVKLRFDEKSIAGLKDNEESQFCPYEFMSKWAKKNGL